MIILFREIWHDFRIAQIRLCTQSDFLLPNKHLQ